MSRIVDELKNVSLDAADKSVREHEIKNEFKNFLTEESESIWLHSLYQFATNSPYKYWDKETLSACLNILEKDKERTLSSISSWDSQTSIAFSNLFQKTSVDLIDSSLDQKRAKDLLRISTEVHPEYLRNVEHVFGNLLCVYWGILRKGGVKAKFSLKSVIPFLEKSDKNFLLSGFDDKIRNGIAHGEIHYKGDGIVYGEIGTEFEYKIDSFQLLDKYDELKRTINSLALAILLFGCRNQKIINEFSWPSGIIECFIRESFSRENFSVNGIVESSYALIGPQLQIGVKTELKKREIILIDCLRIAFEILKINNKTYNRILFDIDTGDSVTSMMAFDVEKLKSHFKNNSEISQVSDAIELNLLWSDENNWKSRLKVYRYLLKTNLNLYMRESKKQFRETVFKNTQDYEIRNVEKQATDEKLRLKIKVVPKGRNDLDSEAVKKIAREVISTFRYKPIKVQKSDLFDTKRLPGLPDYIWVTVHKRNGTLRWLGSRGWLSGNILCESEWIRKKSDQSIMVKNPEEVDDDIRYRFKIDVDAYNSAVKSVNDLVKDVWAERNEKQGSN